MADYKSKFTGAEIDDRLNKMLNVTWAELVALRDEGKLIPGQKYRMIDYETTCTWENTQVAGHPFDIIATALDNKTLGEKCSAIQSERDTDGYFANSNLAAWDVRYCLDNDVKRFDWVQQKGKILYANDGYDDCIGVLDGTIVIDNTTYYKWVCINGWAILCTTSENPSAGEEIIVAEIGYEEDYWNGVAVRIEDREDGKGVVYRLIDEWENSVPYDFKNIMFSHPLTEGKYDVENGVDTFCYTFSCIDWDTFEIADQSVKEPLYCTSNKMGYYSKNNIFLTFSGDDCFSNTFGEGCYNNTFGSYCYNNTFGNGCYGNTFGNGCYGNALGDRCYNNTFGISYKNTFGNGCYGNALGDRCYNNTFGSYCSSNTFGEECYNNTFGNDCYGNALGDRCYNNTFGNGCCGCGFTEGSFNPSENAVAGCHHNIFAEFTERLCLWREPAFSNPKEIRYIKVAPGATMGEFSRLGAFVDTLSNAPQIVVRLKTGYRETIHYDDIINA